MIRAAVMLKHADKQYNNYMYTLQFHYLVRLACNLAN